MRSTPRSILLGLLVTAALTPSGAGAQSVLDRTPNLTGGWVGTAGTAYFNFLHRFEHGEAPTRKVINFPTFLMGYTLGPVLLGANYATNSDLVAGYPNEWEPFARVAAPLGPVRLALTGAYNNAAESVDGEAALTLDAGRLALHGAARGFSSGFGADDARFAVGGGAVLALHANVAVAGDVVTLLDREEGEEVAWGAALQLRIPSTPHTLSLQAANTNTATLQGSSRGADVTRYGFEFTIPITLSRYFGGDGGGAATATGQNEVTVTINDQGFTPARLTISPGTTVTWVNQGQLAHTATAENGSFDSGLIQPGGRYSRRFDQAGETPYLCTPHPFMRGAIIVSGGAR